MRHRIAIGHLRALSLVLLAALMISACSSSSGTVGKTTGEQIDDATITAEVKSKLAAEKISTLTKVDVDTSLRTVYLNGVVNSEEMKQRAGTIAASVRGVHAVVNNLSVKVSG
ncbi:MAG TPA: BON domain-containing protein [Verrucomicrobiae bacterium]|jgi:hyperosmotically inducible protein|nr:BON domain-containing protein [Verrucomicrobiae bacterium]